MRRRLAFVLIVLVVFFSSSAISAQRSQAQAVTAKFTNPSDLVNIGIRSDNPFGQLVLASVEVIPKTVQLTEKRFFQFHEEHIDKLRRNIIILESEKVEDEYLKTMSHLTSDDIKRLKQSSMFVIPGRPYIHIRPYSRTLKYLQIQVTPEEMQYFLAPMLAHELLHVLMPELEESICHEMQMRLFNQFDSQLRGCRRIQEEFISAMSKVIEDHKQREAKKRASVIIATPKP